MKNILITKAIIMNAKEDMKDGIDMKEGALDNKVLMKLWIDFIGILFLCHYYISQIEGWSWGGGGVRLTAQVTLCKSA